MSELTAHYITSYSLRNAVLILHRAADYEGTLQKVISEISEILDVAGITENWNWILLE